MRTCPTVRLIAIDIDGTLLDSRGRVPDANRDAIAEAVARGIVVALVTGRSFHFARPIVDGLPPDLLLIVNNGALVKALDGATIARWLLARDVARRVLQAAQPFRDGAALVFDRFHHPPVAVERIDWEHPNRRGYFERNRPFVTEVAPLEDALVEDPVQVMFNGPVRAMRELAAHLTAHPAADRFAIALTEYAHRDFSLLDVLTVGCSKGATLADQAARRGIPRDAIMAVGDNLNDREMLAFAGVPVVMGNAAPELRALGWPVTGGHDEEGLAAAIRRFALGAPVGDDGPDG